MEAKKQRRRIAKNRNIAAKLLSFSNSPFVQNDPFVGWLRQFEFYTIKATNPVTDEQLDELFRTKNSVVLTKVFYIGQEKSERKCKQMGAQDQWEEAYYIAEKMFNEQRAFTREELNCFQQIICSRYSTVFEYDPYKDEYKFINQELKFEQPVPPKCRTIAEADLDLLKNNAVKSQLKPLTYVNITPIYVVPPSTILVFNYSQVASDELNNALQKAASSLTVNPKESEVTPGGEFVFKHKNGKCYRCIVISEVGDEEVQESERRYEVAFLDHCQIVPVKLKTLFIPGDLTVATYPCALQCVRPIGVAAFRNGFVIDYNNEVRAFYNDREKRKSGLVGLLYKTNRKEQKLIIDFPSIHGHKMTNSEEIKMQHGHLTAAKKDPIILKYDQLINQEPVESLEYDEGCYDTEDEKAVEKKEEDNKEYDDDDVELDLSDDHITDHNITEESKEPSIMKDVLNSECPMGKASIAQFMQRTLGHQPAAIPPPAARPPPTAKPVVVPENNVKASPNDSFSSSVHPNTMQQEQRSNQENTFFDMTCNESVSSRSATINQPASLNPTPLPTYDNVPKAQLTPQKGPLGNGSSDGWGEDTPKKKTEVNEVVTKKREFGDEFGLTEERERLSTPAPTYDYSNSKSLPRAKPPSPASSVKSVSPVQRVIQPLTTTPVSQQSGDQEGNGLAKSLMSLKITTPEKFKTNETVAPIPKAKEKLNEDENKQLPSVAGIIKTDARSHVFGQPRAGSELDRTASTFGGQQSRGSSVSRSEAKQRKQSTLEDDVFNSTNNCELTGSTAQQLHNTSVCQDPNISKTSTNQRLISNAQDMFHDSGDDFESHDAQKHASGKIVEINRQLVEVFPGATSVESMDDDNFSRKSVCSGDFNDAVVNSPVFENDSTPVAATNEFANVADNMKQIASSFLCSIRDAAIQKNHNVYMIEIMAFEVLSQKVSNDLDKRFMRAKLAEAKSLDQAFD